MPRPLDTRLDRVEGKRMAAVAERGSDAIHRRGVWCKTAPDRDPVAKDHKALIFRAEFALVDQNGLHPMHALRRTAI